LGWELIRPAASGGCW